MAAVIVEKACGCFRNSDFEQETQFDTIDEALEKCADFRKYCISYPNELEIMRR